ncbi:thymidylate synthase [Achromobacter phage Motura]|uniref:thymidylate synthase n=1 Tax=Achromobacter phage Motura TaxID=2591403 RepID=A0A514CSH5_9CAUD|nr:thymidylate synthase [Achromobacter phage Motura]QDH83428.1 thymidylate synthase [Achromobacter phage Motura]
MKQYLDTVEFVIANGVRQSNRTGIDTIAFPGASMRFDLRDGFPAVTTKKLAFKSVIGEGIGFLRGVESAKDFRDLGCQVWNQNANENQQWLDNPYRKGEDDLGPVYGSQWRRWKGTKKISRFDKKASRAAMDSGWEMAGADIAAEDDHHYFFYEKEIDQLQMCLDKLRNNPTDRRILFHGWNPAVLDQVALPACHLLYQFLPNVAQRELSMTCYIRSNDLFLGAPFNIAEAAWLLSLFARLSGFTPRYLQIFIGDAHVYVNHLDAFKLQRSREVYASPKLQISDEVPTHTHPAAESIDEVANLIRPEHFTLVDYLHHDPIKADMAV